LGRLGERLAPHSVIGVDTAPFIYFWENHPRYFDLSRELFRYLKNPGIQGVTSTIILIEACVHPQREGRLDLVETYSVLCSTLSRCILCL
jgi:hypothetical protein